MRRYASFVKYVDHFLAMLQGDSAKIGETAKTEEQPIPIRQALPLSTAVPSLPPRKSSEQSTVEHHRNIALQVQISRNTFL